MLVKMLVHIAGTRNGQRWPGIGETVELPDDEAAHYIAQGYCEAAPAKTANATPKGERRSKKKA